MADKKIIIYGKHFASINENVYEKLKELTDVENMTQFIKGNILADFGINIKGSEDIERVDEILPAYYYESKKEWLNSKLRTIIFQYESKSRQNNEVISYFYQIPGTDEYNSSKYLTKNFILDFIHDKAVLKRSEKNYLNIMNSGAVSDTLTVPLISFNYYVYNPDYMRNEEILQIYETMLREGILEELESLPNFHQTAIKIKENMTMKDNIIQRLISEEWSGELGNLISADEIKTKKDVERLEKLGYTNVLDYEVFERLFEGINSSNVYYDKNGIPPRTIYFDKENLIILKFYIGCDMNGEINIMTNNNSLQSYINDFLDYQLENLNKKDFNAFIVTTPRAYREEVVKLLEIKYPEVTVERYQDAINFD